GCSTAAGHRLVQIHPDPSDRQHGARLREAEDQVVGIEAVGVEGVESPSPDHHDKQTGEATEDADRGVQRECATELAYGGDKYQVEEELEPRRVPLLVRIGGCPQPGRVDPERSPRAHIPSGVAPTVFGDDSWIAFGQRCSMIFRHGYPTGVPRLV